MKRVVVNERFTIIDFVLEESQKQLSFWFSFKHEKIWTSCYIYNSQGELIGDVANWSNCSKVITIGEKPTINATTEEVKEGNYKIVIIKQDTQTQEIEIMCNQNIDEDIIAEDPSFIKGVYQGDFKQIVQPKSRYYKGDFHAHTFYSDGENNYNEVKEDLKQYAADFIALTEHNRIAYGKKDVGVLSIPAFELTTPRGHINIHGIKYLAHHNIDFWKEELTINKMLEIYKESLTCICHPFLNPWDFTAGEVNLGDIDVIELINDPTFPDNKEATIEAIKFFDYIWNRGAKIYGVGGSDCHMKKTDCYPGATAPSIFTDPSTYVFCEGLSLENIIVGTKNGHTYITRGLQLDISINDGKVIPGQKVEKGEIDYQINVCNIKSNIKYRFIQDGQIVLQDNIAQREGVASIHHRFRLEDSSYLRFEIVNELDDVVAFINPIYRGDREHVNITYSNAIEQYKQQKEIEND